MAIEQVLKVVSAMVSTGVELAAVVVIALAALHVCVSMLWGLWRRGRKAPLSTEHFRLQLGQWLSVALELLLAADILRTAVAPSWDDLGKLAAIVVIRTALNWFLQRDIAEVRHREPGA